MTTTVDPDLTRHLAAQGDEPLPLFDPTVPQPRPGAALSWRELQVVALAANGLSNVEIGACLYLTAATVKSHLARVYRRTGLGRCTVVGWCLRSGQVRWTTQGFVAVDPAGPRGEPAMQRAVTLHGVPMAREEARQVALQRPRNAGETVAVLDELRARVGGAA